MYDRDRFAPVLFHFFFAGFPAVRGKIQWPGKQVIQKTAVSVIQMLRDLGEQVFKIIIWFQIIGCDMPLAAQTLATLMPAGRLWHSLIWAAHSWRRKLAAMIDVCELIDLPPCSGIKSWDSTFHTRNRNIVYYHTLFHYSRGTDYLPFTKVQIFFINQQTLFNISVKF